MAQPLTTEYLEKVLEQKLTKKFDEFKYYFENYVDKKFALLVERCDNLEAQIQGLEQKMNLRFSIIEAELEDIKTKLKEYSKRDLEDSNAINKVLVKLQKRMSNLEAQLKKIKINQKQSAKI